MTYESIGSAHYLDLLNKALDVLFVFPEAGHRYDPLFEAARPPFEVLEFFTERHGIYYSLMEDERVLYVRFIEDLRADPGGRFSADAPEKQ